jgi:hypothetical protein
MPLARPFLQCRGQLLGSMPDRATARRPCARAALEPLVWGDVLFAAENGVPG